MKNQGVINRLENDLNALEEIMKNYTCDKLYHENKIKEHNKELENLYDQYGETQESIRIFKELIEQYSRCE